MLKQETQSFNLKLNLLILLGIILLNYCQFSYRESQALLQKNHSELGMLVAQKSTALVLSQATKYTVGIYHKNKAGTCTGVIVSPRSILTAAHCVEESGDSVEIRFGSDILSDYQKYESEKIYVSSKYRGSKFGKQKGLDTYDLALIYLPKDIPSSYEVVKVYQSSDSLKNGTPLVFAGYGENIKSPAYRKRPLRSGIIYISDSDFSDSEFAISQNRGFGPCKGDSGGPAFSFMQGELQLAGVISRGDHHCTLTVYTHFEKIKNFLEESEIQKKQKNLSLLEQEVFRN